MNFYGKKIVYVVNNDWYFLSHRLELARAAKDYGARVIVAAKDNGHREAITAEGFRFYPLLQMESDNTDPVKEIRAVAEIAAIYMKEKPDLAHHIALKSVLDGCIAAHFAKLPRLVNTASGLGYIFTENTLRTKVLRTLVLSLIKVFHPREKALTVFMNPHDGNIFMKSEVLHRKQVRLIRGSGVDTELFSPTPEPEGWPVVSLVSRMLWDKGVSEFVEAARLLRERGVQARFQLVGNPDPGNPSSVPKRTLEQWDAHGFVEWIGYRADVPKVYRKSHIACLPSYREGLPKTLLEAAAAQRPIVTTNIPGCRQVVRHEVNGLLVPPKDAVALADALQQLIASKPMREKMGRAGRCMVERSFTLDKVNSEYLKLYERLLSEE